jgi:hypothetical protein
MKLFSVLVCALALTRAACGHDHGNGNGDNHAHGNEDGHGHGHDDHHGGEATELGHHEEGIWHVGASILGHCEPGKEAVFEIHVKKEGKLFKQAGVEGWIGDEKGEKLSKVQKGEWRDDEQLYDCHIDAPATLPEKAHFWVRMRQDNVDILKGWPIPKE